ncbi:hypothetical protein YC2023_051045 [Brassica napus]
MVGIGTVNDVLRARAEHAARMEEKSSLRRDLTAAKEVIADHRDKFTVMTNMFDLMIESNPNGIRLRKLLAESFVLLKKWSKKASDCLEVLNSDSWWLRSHLVEYGVVVDSKGNVVHERDLRTCLDAGARLEEPGQKTEDSFSNITMRIQKRTQRRTLFRPDRLLRSEWRVGLSSVAT